MTVDELTVDELTIDDLTWYRLWWIVMMNFGWFSFLIFSKGCLLHFREMFVSIKEP